MTFQFVENSSIDGATRKLIRSHVMKGKNVGKSHPQRARRQRTEVLVSNKISEVGKSDVIRLDVASMPQTPGNSFSFFALPIYEQPYMRFLIHQFLVISTQSVYPKELCMPVQAAQGLWFQYLLSDGACFHGMLAMAEACVNAKRGNYSTTPLAMHHLSKTYRCINESLQRNPVPSDATVAAVMSMAIHDDLTGSPHKSKVHLDALERMVELRGGIDQFATTRILLHKICRADIEYALHNGSRPRLYRDEFPRDMVSCLLATSINMKDEIVQGINVPIQSATLQHIKEDLTSISRLLNSDPAYFRLEPMAYQETLISACYRLLDHSPLANRNTVIMSDYEELCHLGMVGMMTTLLFQHGAFRPVPYDLLKGRMRSAIERAGDDLTRNPIYPWLLFMAGISVFRTTEDRAWLLPHVQQCLSRLCIDDWQSARIEIRRFPWIDAVHDRLGHQLWQDLTLNFASGQDLSSQLSRPTC